MRAILSKATQSIVLPRDPAVLNLFPNARKLNDTHCVVHHGLREFMLLRHMGLKVPHPMLEYYDWRGGTPFSVQKITCELLASCARAYVLNDLGTGKTKALLWAWDYLYGNKYAQKLLVVCPISTMNFVWAREAFATLPHRKVVVLYGTKKQRLDALNQDADIYVINHDGIRVILPELAARTDIDTLGIDELAVYRNNSDRSKIMRKFAQRFNWIWGMTGEPMPNEPTDVWSQALIVTPTTVPKRFRHAQEMLMYPVNKFKWLPKPDATETAFKMMQPSVRFSLDDVTELPEVIHRFIDVPLSTEQQGVYKKLADAYHTMVGTKAITAVNAGAAVSKLLQISSGWVYTQAPDFVALNPYPRINAAIDLIMDSAHKVLLFVPYRHAGDGMAAALTEEKIEFAHVDGSTPSAERDQIFNSFQNTSKYKVLLAHPQCLAHGITLTAANTVIWFSPPTSLETYDQANARIRRIGQKNKQLILHLQGTPIEKKMYGMLRAKQKLQDKFLELCEEATERKVK